MGVVSGAVAAVAVTSAGISISVSESLKEYEKARKEGGSGTQRTHRQKRANCPHGKGCPQFGTYQYECVGCELETGKKHGKRRISYLQCRCLGNKDQPYFSKIKLYGHNETNIINVRDGGLVSEGRYAPHKWMKRNEILSPVKRRRNVRKAINKHKNDPSNKQAYNNYKAARELENKNLFEFIQSENEVGLKQILEKGFKVDIINKKGRTPLLEAARFVKYWKMKLLIEAGADVNHQDNEGKTALIYIIKNKNVSDKLRQDMVTYLIDSKALKNIKDKSGKTAIDYAQIMENSNSKQLLINYLNQK